MGSSDNNHSCPRCGPNRRDFLRRGLGLATLGATGLWLPGCNSDTVTNPVKTGGSTDPFPIPELDKNGSHNQAPGPGHEPSLIYHFKGQIARSNDFAGTATDNSGNKFSFGGPTTDFAFMRGTYFAPDRMEHTANYFHLWISIFQGAVASNNKVHDFHPSIAPSGLFWTVPIPDSALVVSADGKSATLQVTDLSITDQPNWPVENPTLAATISLKVTWAATSQAVSYVDPALNFAVTGFAATSQVEFTAKVSSSGFTLKSDAPASASFGVIGNEVNGKYFGT